MLSRKKIAITVSLLFIFSVKPFAQVNLQTGSAVFSLPLFNWQDDKSRLVSTVALSYNSGNGLKVSDVASNVGQGWNLVAGGVITRMQVSEPDDQIADSLYPTWHDQDITKYPNGYLYHKTDPSLGCPSALTKYPTYGGQNVLYTQHTSISEDKQLDYFSFQFNGKSGMFILDTTGGDHGVPLGNTKMQITFQRDPSMTSLGIRTTITAFTVTDVDGLIYKFTLHGLTKLLKADYCSADGNHIQGQPKISNGGVYYQNGFDLGPSATPWYNTQMANPYIISSWYLSEIDDPYVSRKITFAYHTLNLTNNAGADISYNYSSDKYVVVSYKKSITSTLEIDSIIYQDGHSVIFNYTQGTQTRFDFPGEKAIASVDIKYQGRYLSRYILNTTYFVLNRYGNPTSPQEQKSARLCLKSVKKIGPDLKEDSPPYQFDYYTSTGSGQADDFVPPPFCYSKDIWGFYNGNSSKLADNSGSVPLNQLYSQLTFNALKGLCFQNSSYTGSGVYLNANPNYAENGILKQIIYPTGGSLTYTYAQNTGTFINGSGVNNVGGVHVSQTSSSDGGYSNGCANPIVTQYNYVVNGPGSASSLWGLEAPLNSVVTNNNYKEEKQTIHWSFPLNFTCKWHYIYPGILSQTEAVGLTWWQETMTALAPYLAVVSFVMDVIDVIEVIGSANSWNIIGVILDVISTVIGLFFTCSSNPLYTPNTIYYNFDLNGGAPLPVQFKQVEITESPGTIGKTVQVFTHGDPNTPLDPHYYALWDFAGNNTVLSPKQRFAPWAYGLPYLTTVYDANGNKIKETQNVYDFSYAKIQIVLGQPCLSSHCFASPITSCKCQVINNYSLRSDTWSNPANYNNPASYLTTPGNTDMGVDIYYMYTGRAQLKTTYERNYRTTDATQFVLTETDYYYNSPTWTTPNCVGASCTIANYDVNLIVTTQSNGDVNYKSIKYNSDYNTGILATMVQKNIFSVPVSTNTYVSKNGGSGYQYLSEKVTEFSQLSNGDVKPSRILEQRFATPASSITLYSGPTTTNYTPYKIPQVFTYDVNGNLTGLKDEGTRNVTNIYDYNDKYITASVINADPVADKPAYTSFESQDLSRSGWVLGGSSAYNLNTVSPTGSNTFTVLANSANSLTASGLNTSKAYILSFWSSNGNVSVYIPGYSATVSKTGPSINSYSYYEYNIPAGSPSVKIYNNNNTVATNIDELRLYPSNSRMRTTTYDPVLGKTSECDENNRIMYYTYDNLGRLQFVKDESGNVTKTYEYNNVSAAKQTGCPGSYSNKAVSETFTRNNCGTGYQGSDVTYTVGAGVYTSTISQYDADIQTEINVLTNGQNYSNTNGSCALIYYNTVQSVSDTTQTCPDGYTGGTVTYTVPAGTYSSIISQADANQQALNDIAANAIAYANFPANAVCNINTTPDWEWFPGDSTAPADPSYCLSVNGQLPPHQFILVKDVNPNSSTYNQTQYVDYGPQAACPANTYFNAQQSQNFTRNNCGTGYTGSTVTYTVQPGKYSSTVSQAAANQLATNDINANGQNYANANGTCTSNCSFSANTGFGIVTSGISSSGSTVNFNIVFYPTSSQFNVGNSYQIATINGGCHPSATRNVTITSSGRTWIVTIYTGGQFYAYLQSGSALPINQAASLSGSYSL
jgi:hypothetical protein